MRSTDIAIVGGGIAGLTLAKFLAESKKDFMLLEDHTKLGMKACGEGFFEHFKGYEFLDLYGSRKGIQRRVERTKVKLNIGEWSLAFPFFTTNKEVIEGELARQARRSGANIAMGQRVMQIRRENGYFILYPQMVRAKFLVGADGLNSVVRDFLGFPKSRFNICVEGELKKKTGPEATIDISGSDPGNSWFFPKKKTWNIGSMTDVKNARLLQEFKKKFAPVKEWRAGAVPYGLPWRSYSKDAILLGDAAPQVLPVAEGGNMPSMIAAKISADLLSKGKSAADIDRGWKKVMWGTFFVSRIYHDLTYNHFARLSLPEGIQKKVGKGFVRSIMRILKRIVD